METVTLESLLIDEPKTGRKGPLAGPIKQMALDIEKLKDHVEWLNAQLAAVYINTKPGLIARCLRRLGL